MKTQLQRIFIDHFVALILDNEVTVGEFVTIRRSPGAGWRGGMASFTSPKDIPTY